MRWVLGVALAASLVAGGAGGIRWVGAGEAVTATRGAQNRPADDGVRWGEVAFGVVRAGARLDRYYYGVKDDPEVTVLLDRVAAGEIPPAPPGAPYDPTFVNVELVRDGRESVHLHSTWDQQTRPDPLASKVEVVEKGKLWRVRFKLSELTANAVINPLKAGEYRLLLNVLWPESAVAARGENRAEAGASRWVMPRVQAGEIRLEVTERVPVGPMTQQPQREDLRLMVRLDNRLRMEFEAWGRDEAKAGLAVVDSPVSGAVVKTMWDEVQTGKRKAGTKMLIGRFAGESFSRTVGQFIREGNTIRIKVKRTNDPKLSPSNQVEYLEAPLPRLLPGKYTVILESVDAGQPAMALAQEKRLTCEFEVPDPAAGIEKAAAQEAFERQTYELLQTLTKKMPVAVSVRQIELVGPEGKRGYQWESIMSVVTDRQNATTGLTAVVAGEEMKKVLHWLATEGYFEHQVMTMHDHSTVRGYYELNMGDYAINLTAQEAAWILEGMDGLLGAKSPGGLKEAAKRISDNGE